MTKCQNKDENVRIYVMMDKHVYQAGDMIFGTVYLKATMVRPYEHLYIGLVSNEQVQWHEPSGERDQSHTRKMETYRQAFVLASFEDGINIGQYSYPFTMLLPSSLPATLFIDKHNLINNSLHAYLPAFDTSSSMQSYTVSLHLREPLRVPQHLKQPYIQLETSCCCNYFQVCKTHYAGKYSMQVQRKIISKEQFKVKGFVDNSKGNSFISNMKLVLCQKITKMGSQRTYIDKSQVEIVHDFQQSIKAGERKQFDLDLRIKSQMAKYTAIGYLITRTYYIQLIGEMSCCYDDVVLSKSILLNPHTITSEHSEQQKKYISQMKPVMYKRIQLLNLKPYSYRPFASTIISRELNQDQLPMSVNSHVNLHKEKVQM